MITQRPAISCPLIVSVHTASRYLVAAHVWCKLFAWLVRLAELLGCLI
jgi:hypothetical protein